MLGAPVATTAEGKGSIPEDHPLALGGSYHGMGGPAGATPQADVLLAVGTRFSRQMAGGTRPNASQLLVHIDADAEVFGRNFPAKVAIAADAKMALSDLLDEIRERVQRRDGRSRRSPKFVKLASSRSRSVVGVVVGVASFVGVASLPLTFPCQCFCKHCEASAPAFL